MKLAPDSCYSPSTTDNGALWQPLSIPIGVGSWLLIRAHIRADKPRGATILFCQYLDGTEERITLPVSRRGNLLELVRLSAPLRQLSWQPANSGASCQYHLIELRAVSWLERCLRQWQRVLPMYRRPRLLRIRSGLSRWLPLQDLSLAYRIAGELRDDRRCEGYDSWVAQFDHIGEGDRRRIRQQISRWKNPPLIHIHLIGNLDIDALHRTLVSLSHQLYFNMKIYAPAIDGQWPFSILESVSEINSGWHMCLPIGSQLSEHALYWFAFCALEYPRCKFIYSDHDQLLVRSPEQYIRHSPCFKPNWSPTLLHGQNYIGWSAVWYQDKYGSLPGGTGEAIHAHWLSLSVSLFNDSICHIASPLLHICEDHVAAVKMCPIIMHHQIYGTGAKVHDVGAVKHISWPLPSELPRVSVIIPTRNGLDHLRPCIESLVNRTDYPFLDILVIDNQTNDSDTLMYFDEIQRHYGVRVLLYDYAFNYSAINNYAAQMSHGELLCLLNNDTEVINPNWLREMVSHLLRPGVGVVGAKLLYENGHVQHGGDAVGPGGCADHLHHGLARDEPGYCSRALCAQELSAVTGACLLTYKSIYLQLGGLDSVHLPVAFNDVDYCLRVQELGLSVIWTPFAELYHHESVSRGKDVSLEQKVRAKRELDYMRTRWKKRLEVDPYYNPNLNYDRPDFSLSRSPRVSLPWMK